MGLSERRYIHDWERERRQYTNKSSRMPPKISKTLNQSLRSHMFLIVSKTAINRPHSLCLCIVIILTCLHLFYLVYLQFPIFVKTSLPSFLNLPIIFCPVFAAYEHMITTADTSFTSRALFSFAIVARFYYYCGLLSLSLSCSRYSLSPSLSPTLSFTFSFVCPPLSVVFLNLHPSLSSFLQSRIYTHSKIIQFIRLQSIQPHTCVDYISWIRVRV